MARVDVPCGPEEVFDESVQIPDREDEVEIIFLLFACSFSQKVQILETSDNQFVTLDQETSNSAD